jgi:anti-anti-sigma regulatory factor
MDFARCAASTSPSAAATIDEFLDSTAAGILLEARPRSGRARISIAGASRHVGRALDVCGLDGQVPTYPTLAAAISQPG